MANERYKTPKFNKRTGLYGKGGGNRNTAPGSGVLRGIGDAVKSLVGATKAGDKRRAARSKNRAERKQIRATKKDLKQQYKNLGSSRGDARRMARANAPGIVAKQKEDKIAKLKAENQRKRAIKNDKRSNKPISLDKKTISSVTQTKPSPATTKSAATKPGKKDNVYEYTDRSGKKTSYDPTKKKSRNNSMAASDLKKVTRGGIKGPASARDQKNLYQNRAKGNRKNMFAAKKSGKEEFEYTSPRTGVTRKVKVSNYKVG